MINKESFFRVAVRIPEYREVEIEGLGKVYIKRLTAGEKDAFERKAGDNIDRALTLVHCLFDERGERIFSDDDLLALKQADPCIIDPIIVEALKFNAYTKDERDVLLKNLTGQAATS